MSDPRLSVDPQTVANVAEYWESIGRLIGDKSSDATSLYSTLNNGAHLPPDALGVIGRGTVRQYNASLSRDLTDLALARGAAQGIVDAYKKTAANYQDAEANTYHAARSVAVQNLLYQAGMSPDRNENFKPVPGPDEQVAPLPTPPKQVSGTVLLDFAGGGIGASAAVIGLSEAARFSGTTLGLLKVAGRLSLSALAGVAIAVFMEVPDDSVINDAQIAYGLVAESAKMIFGRDVGAVTKALEAAWQSSEALPAAAAKIREFVTAGVEFANRAERRAQGLRKMVSDLNTFHKLALDVSAVALGVMVLISGFAIFSPVAYLKLQQVAIALSKWLALAAVTADAILAFAAAEWLAADQRASDTPWPALAGVPQTDFVT